MTERERMIEAAVRWAERGFYVFPLPYGRKAPPPAKWPKIASNDPNYVRVWLEDITQPVNLAIVPGKSGHAVLDVDGAAGREAIQEIFEGKPPETLTWRTGRRGGAHFLYELPAGKTLSSRRISEDLDCKSDGGYVLVPPSKHPSGAHYEMVRDTDPARLLRIHHKAIEERAGAARTADNAPEQEGLRAPSVAELMVAVDAIPNDETWDRDRYVKMGAAIKAAAGPENEEEAFEIWREWAERWTEGVNEPETLKRDWAGLHPPYLLGWNWIHKVSEEESWPDAEEAFREELGDAIPERPEWLYTWADILLDDDLDDEAEELLDYCCWRGKLSYLWAKDKAGKSTFCRAMVARALRENPGLTVLWLDYEERRKGFRDGLSETPVPKDPGEPEWPSLQRAHYVYQPTMEQVKQAVTIVRPDAIVVDTLTSAIRYTRGEAPESWQKEEWNDFMLEWADLTADTEGNPLAGVVIFDHALRKEDRYHGSIGKGAGADIQIGLLERRGTARRLEYRGRMANISRVDVTVTRNPDGTYSEQLPEPEELRWRKQIWHHVNDNPGASKTDLYEAGLLLYDDGNRVGRGKLAEIVDDMVADGILEDEGTGNNTALRVAESADHFQRELEEEDDEL